MVISSIFLSFDNEILNVAAKLEKRCEAARAIAANALPGLDRLYWSKVAQDYAAMARTLRATVVLHHPEPWRRPDGAMRLTPAVKATGGSWWSFPCQTRRQPALRAVFHGSSVFSCYNLIMDQNTEQAAADQQPLWTQDEAIAFEVAREAINHVMSIYTSAIADQERRPEQDTAIIASLEARLTSLHRERTALRLKDHAEIARIRKEYGAFVRAWNTRQDLLAAG
jgi:hypothetical protein